VQASSHGGWPPAATANRTPTVWVLLADSHIAANRERVQRGVKMADNLGRVVAELAGGLSFGTRVSRKAARPFFATRKQYVFTEVRHV
jgi:hypothetical protein